MKIHCSKLYDFSFTGFYILLLFFAITRMSVVAGQVNQLEGKELMSPNEQVIREFIAAWSNLDPEELAAYFTEEATYHNIPSQPVTGRDNIQNFIAGFIRPWEATDWEIVSLVADGERIMVERLDKTVVAGQPVNLPCVGVFEMESGQIKVWRDYFDLTTYTEQLSEALNQSASPN